MTQPIPREDFVFTFPNKDEHGQDFKWRFMLTLSKSMGHDFGSKEDTVERRLIRAVGTLDGIDRVVPGVGRYTIEVCIARTFNPDEVIEELRRRLMEDVLSEIIKPKLINL